MLWHSKNNHPSSMSYIESWLLDMHSVQLVVELKILDIMTFLLWLPSETWLWEILIPGKFWAKCKYDRY